MAKLKYKQKPQFWYCVQYTGENPEELVAFAPGHCSYDPVGDVLIFDLMPVTPTNWILEDMSGVFSMKIDSQFNAFFSLDAGPEAKPA